MLIIENVKPKDKYKQEACYSSTVLPPGENPENVYTSSLFLLVILQEAIFGCEMRNDGPLMEVLGLH